MDKPSIKKNIAYQMAYELMVLLLPLITSPYISRVLGAEKIGIYSYTYSIATYFGMACMLGVKNHGNRAIARCKGNQKEINKTFSSVYSTQLLVSIAVFIAYIFFAIRSSSEYRMYFLIETFYVLSCVLDINWLFFGLEKFKITVVRSSIIKVLSFVLIFLLVKNQSDLWKYCLILTGCALLSQIVMWTYLPKYAKFIRPRRKDIMGNYKPMFILFIPVIAVSLYNVMDKIMVGALSDKVELGFYENSEKIINCVKTVITSFGTVMMPRMSRLAAEKDLKQSNKYMLLSVDAVMFLAFAFAFGIAAVSNVFAPLYWGSEFQACDALLIGLSVSLPFSAMANMIRTQYMIPNSMDNPYTMAVLIGAVVNLAINFALIPQLGAVGAVIGTIFAEGGVCLIQLFWVRKKIPILTYMKKSIPFFFFGLVMWICVTVINKLMTLMMSSVILLLIEILIGAFIYCLLSFIYFVITKNEMVIGVTDRIIYVLKKHRK